MGFLDELLGAFGGSDDKSSGGASIWPSVISAGTQLAGTYFSLKQNKEINDQNIALAQAKLEAEKELAAKGGGGGGSGQGLAIARLNNLGALYQNWGQLAAKAAETESQAAQATGRLATDPIIARLGAIR